MGSIGLIKRRFAIIIGGISLLFIINLFYLTGLYKEIVDDTTKIVILSIEEADGEELQNRLVAISSSLSDRVHETITIDKSIVIEEDEDSGKESSESTIASIAVFSQLMKEVRQTVHHTIDTIMPPNLFLLDSLIVANFKHKGISTRLYNSEIVDMNTGVAIASSNATAAKKSSNSYLYEYQQFRENFLSLKIKS